MKFFADFHIHSRYSRGTNPDMEIATIVRWAKMKGISLLGTGDFTHPQWLVELKKFLKPTSGRGVYEYDDVRFILTAEVGCSYTRAGRDYKVHHVVFAPNFSTADRLYDALAKYGNLESEARATVSLTAEEFVKAVLDVSAECLVIPAHPWGPQQSLFSPQYGFDRLLDAYGAQAENIRVLETGLCYDPAHVRRWSQLDGRALVSNSDAHHPRQLGREANLFDCPIDYKDITTALVKNDRSRLLGTIEVFPEEDRFYLGGHKECQTRADHNGKSGSCPKCGKKFLPGVVDRMELLADRSREEAAAKAEPFYKLVSLQDVIADVLGFQPEADSVVKQYAQITTQIGPELPLLLNWAEEQLRKQLPLRLVEGILALRRGEVSSEPGYDGVSGRVRVKLPDGIPVDSGQLKLF